MGRGSGNPRQACRHLRAAPGENGKRGAGPRVEAGITEALSGNPRRDAEWPRWIGCPTAFGFTLSRRPKRKDGHISGAQRHRNASDKQRAQAPGVEAGITGPERGDQPGQPPLRAAARSSSCFRCGVKSDFHRCPFRNWSKPKAGEDGTAGRRAAPFQHDLNVNAVINYPLICDCGAPRQMLRDGPALAIPRQGPGRKIGECTADPGVGNAGGLFAGCKNA